MDKRLIKFLEAQNQFYLKALSEIRNGKKVTHWMWFVFPQIKGLGLSEKSKFYGITDLEEAEAYLTHPILGKHLIEISEALLNIENKNATDIFGTPDDLKLQSSMTLFSKIKDTNPIFIKVLEKYFRGNPDLFTEQIVHQNPH